MDKKPPSGNLTSVKIIMQVIMAVIAFGVLFYQYKIADY